MSVLPTHGFGSFCSATPTTGTSSTLEDQRTANPALTSDEESFVAGLLAGYDAYPAYYAHMGPINLAGPAPVDLTPPQEVDGDELRRRVAAGEWVVDLRAREAYARGHLPGTYAFEGAGNVATWLGWLLPWGAPVTLVGESAEQVADVQRALVRIGIDRPAGRATAPVEQLAGPEGLAQFPLRTFADLAAARRDGDVHVLDVRRQGEWDAGHVEGAQHVPLPELAQRAGEVPEQVWVHCASGFRASIAGSVLERAGHRVTVVSDAFDAAAEAGLPVVTD